MSNFLKNRVAIVTGAGGGLGRTHALELARHGAQVVVNDLGESAQAVAQEIRRAGGQAIAHQGDVTRYEDMEAMAAHTVAEFGRVDILVNNAGVLRDRSFAKMSLDEFRLVLDVHVMGTVHATKAVWSGMRERNYGRIIMTTSSSGLYGNFGQSNYGAAKMALVGLMQTLALEGAARNVRVNCLAPSAVTAMTEGLLPPEAQAVMTPERVSTALLALVGEDAPTRMILLAGGGSFESAQITMTQGIHITDGNDPAVTLPAKLAQVQDQAGQMSPASGWDQARHEVAKALAGGSSG
ncbi:SDR family NAD(P)-dependent oxidoreductase [Achromobacter spanius]|uniref:SDR family NAD(P)-dependent oxidoreductase n=1 Tax=Achromobacter spanius TaxID=217203 RepID=UPI002227B227|nr:SDR family NAD(P)-dependent oxidoreductase [Achromobacter spanius]MCW3153715.1 SDR family NAD(P)-dependent oxidoreductase [Achromobacter spanius]